MTTELIYLTLTALWLASLWIPFIAGRVRYDGANLAKNLVTPPNHENLPPWVRRSNRAHLNLVEQFGPYAALIVLLHLLGVSNVWTVGAAAAFFWLRIAHSIVMWAGVPIPVRPTIFTACYLCILVLGWQALAA